MWHIFFMQIWCRIKLLDYGLQNKRINTIINTKTVLKAHGQDLSS